MRLGATGFAALVAVAAVWAPAAHAQGAGAPRLVKELEIADAPGGLTAIGPVLVSRAGDVYVTQAQDNVVLQFDSTGRFVRKIGRKGQGPGETEHLSNVGFVGDTLWTYDWMTGRFSLFSPSGAFYSAFRPPAIVDSTNAKRRTSTGANDLLANGAVYYASHSFASYIEFDLLGPLTEFVATRDGARIATVAAETNVGRTSFGFAVGNGQAFSGDGALGSMIDVNPRVAVGAGGAWLAVAEQSQCGARPRYMVSRLSPRGDTLWHATVACPNVPVPCGFLDSVVAFDRDKAVKIWKIAPSYAESQVRGKIGEVKEFAVLRELKAGRDGSIWIRPFAISPEPQVWVRADARAGAPESFTLPPRTSLKLIVDSSHIWAVVSDADDVQTLVRYRIER